MRLLLGSSTFLLLLLSLSLLDELSWLLIFVLPLVDFTLAFLGSGIVVSIASVGWETVPPAITAPSIVPPEPAVVAGGTWCRHCCSVC